MDIYAQNILDRYKKPYFKSEKRKAESGKQMAIDEKDLPLTAYRLPLLVEHKEANHSCGDVVEVEMALEEGEIKQYRFSGAGCAISMAAADMLGDLIVGMTEKEALELTKDEVYEMLGIEISVRRSKCALLGLLAIQNGLLSHQNQALRSWKEYHISE